VNVRTLEPEASHCGALRPLAETQALGANGGGHSARAAAGAGGGGEAQGANGGGHGARAAAGAGGEGGAQAQGATAHAQLLTPEAAHRRKAPMAAAAVHARLLEPRAGAVRRRKMLTAAAAVHTRLLTPEAERGASARRQWRRPRRTRGCWSRRRRLRVGPRRRRQDRHAGWWRQRTHARGCSRGNGGGAQTPGADRCAGTPDRSRGTRAAAGAGGRGGTQARSGSADAPFDSAIVQAGHPANLAEETGQPARRTALQRTRRL